MPAPIPPRGRGAAENPPNRFDRVHLELDVVEPGEDARRQVKTELLHDTTRSALSRNTSPDIPFDYSLNPYRGCEHGCSYCYARPTHEYLGFSPGLDFETKIVVKPDAPRLLSEAFQKPSWTPAVVSVSGATDPYQPVERRLRLTRACLEVFLRHRNPVSIITKNALVTRDLDLLRALAALGLVHVRLSITSLRDDVIRAMEPRTSRPAARLRAVRTLAEAGVPVAVHAAPIIPGLTDEELPAIYAAAAEAGAQSAGFMVVRLPGAVGELFPAWLRQHFPDRYEKVMGRLTEVRGGRLDEGRFHERFRLHGPWAEALRQVARIAARRHGLDRPLPPLATHHFRRLAKGQMDLF
jgi:DNA repair photolyase